MVKKMALVVPKKIKIKMALGYSRTYMRSGSWVGPFHQPIPHGTYSVEWVSHKDEMIIDTSWITSVVFNAESPAALPSGDQCLIFTYSRFLFAICRVRQAWEPKWDLDDMDPLSWRQWIFYPFNSYFGTLKRGYIHQLDWFM